jgi:gamma-glutamyl hercynylcysteine S-oxide synthase
MVVQPINLHHSLLHRLGEARAESDSLFEIVRPEAIFDRPIPARHRILFYVGHLEAFDWNLLRERVLGEAAFHPEFDRLFAFGIDPVGGGLPTDQPSDWPSLVEVRRYVNGVRSRLDEALDSALANTQSREFSADLLLNVAIEHRLMHAETLAYMLHQMPLDRKVQRVRDTEPIAPAMKPEMVEVPAGPATLGLRRDSAEFGWDNEYEEDMVEVSAFAIDKHKVSNRQYMEFVASGGYQERSLWTEEGWKWIGEAGITHPSFWRQQNGFWLLRTMFDEIPLPLEWPVYVSHAEAAAYARWAGKSLPSEAQWQRAAWASGEQQGIGAGLSPVRALREGNFNFRRWDPSPVGADVVGPSGFGVRGMVGNGWEWTSTLFGPLPGFKPFPFYLGYSADFFDNKHYVMKGGSARTAACMLRPSFRNWFQPHYPYVYAGFRCVKN